MKQKVLVAMSGGVDSSVAAFLLQEAGYEVAGATMQLFSSEGGPSGRSSEKNAEDAKSVATVLGIEHFVIDLSREFKQQVMDRFARAYQHGETPNPCVDCNRLIKFSLLYEKARELGFDRIATGHYVRCEFDDSSGRWLLKKGIDQSKDQSYVLYPMTQEMLSKTLFPLGTLSKEEVRRVAETHRFINADRPDSQDICFIPDGDYRSFLEREYKMHSPEGDFIAADGKVLGRHRGTTAYTTGQRRGLGVSADRPLYVIRKDLTGNTVTLGDEKDLYSDRLLAKDVNFISVKKLEKPMCVGAKIRYSQKTAEAVISPAENENVLVTFHSRQRAVTAGQAVVFYNGDIVVGGGTIQLI